MAKADLSPDKAREGTSCHRRMTSTSKVGLAGQDYLAGDYSIADMCCWTWIDKYPGNGGGLDAFRQVRSWHERIAARPAVRRALRFGEDWGTRRETGS